jgi:hypothetical protein
MVSVMTMAMAILDYKGYFNGSTKLPNVGVHVIIVVSCKSVAGYNHCKNPVKIGH